MIDSAVRPQETLCYPAVYFARLGYHAVGIDRRKSARVLDDKAKFLTNYADPVRDLLWLIDFFHEGSQYRFSKIGIYGFSAGAAEGKFAAALDDRISAVVLACSEFYIQPRAGHTVDMKAGFVIAAFFERWLK